MRQSCSRARALPTPGPTDRILPSCRRGGAQPRDAGRFRGNGVIHDSVARSGKPAEDTCGANSGSVSLSQGVIEFSLCLLFAKLVSYTFLFWLPLYITSVGEYSLLETHVEFAQSLCP